MKTFEKPLAVTGTALVLAKLDTTPASAQLQGARPAVGQDFSGLWVLLVILAFGALANLCADRLGARLAARGRRQPPEVARATEVGSDDTWEWSAPA